MAKAERGKMVKAGKNLTGVYFRLGTAGEKTFYIVFREAGKLIWERIGSESEGFTAQSAYQTRKDRLVLGSNKATKLTLDGAFKRLVLNIRADGAGDEYVSQVIGRYNRHLKDVLGEKGLQEISVEDLNNLKLDLFEKGFALSYVKDILRVVKQVYSDVIKSNVYHGFNPTGALKFKRANTRKTRALTVDESIRLLAELKRTNVDVYRRTAFALYAGLRKGEIAKLTRADIDLGLGLIRVRDAKSPNEDHKVRKAYFPVQLRAVIEEIYAERPVERSDLLFPGSFRDDIFIDTVKSLGLNEGREKLDRLTFHGLRHTHATMVGGLSKNPYVVKDQLGHGDIAMAMRYTHVENQSAQYVQLLGEAFAQREAELKTARQELKVIHVGR